MSLKKSEWRELEKERERFMAIMDMTLERVNQMRVAKFSNILKECPDSRCADEALESYNEVNHEVDKFLDRISHEVNACIQIEKEIKPAGTIHCFSKFEYITRYEISKLDLQ
jgi:hypothetical protein